MSMWCLALLSVSVDGCGLLKWWCMQPEVYHVGDTRNHVWPSKLLIFIIKNVLLWDQSIQEILKMILKISWLISGVVLISDLVRCRSNWQDVFLCDLSAFDALILLRPESLPSARQALHPSAIQMWASSTTSTLDTVSSALRHEVKPSSTSRAILSHIPKCGSHIPQSIRSLAYFYGW